MGSSISLKTADVSLTESKVYNEMDLLTLERLAPMRKDVEPPEDGFGEPPKVGNVTSKVRKMGVLHARNHTTPLPESEPDLVGGVVTDNHYSFTTRIEVLGGRTVHRAQCVALLDSRSPSITIDARYKDAMLANGSVTAGTARKGHRLRRRGFKDDPAPQTSHLIRLSVQFSLKQQPTAKLTVRAYVVSDKVLQQEIPLGKDSYLRFDLHDYTVMPQKEHQRVLGEIPL